MDDASLLDSITMAFGFMIGFSPKTSKAMYLERKF